MASAFDNFFSRSDSEASSFLDNCEFINFQLSHKIPMIPMKINEKPFECMMLLFLNSNNSNNDKNSNNFSNNDNKNIITCNQLHYKSFLFPKSSHWFLGTPASAPWTSFRLSLCCFPETSFVCARNVAKEER